jgi:hypothetical protein
MPSVPVLPASKSRSYPDSIRNPLPTLLQTPNGFALLELQGTIHAPAAPLEVDDVDMDGVSSHSQDTPVGKLVFPLWTPSTAAEDTSWMKRVYLYIGKHQRLTGEVKKLPKAMALLKKNEEAEEEVVEIAEIVRYKIVFSQRPEPVGDE